MTNQSIRKLTFLACILLIACNGVSQTAFVIPASAQALGNSGVSLSSSEAFNLNPASVSGTGLCFGVNYINRFLLKDLSTVSGFCVLPIASSRLIASYGQFGNNSYQESLAELGLAKGFGDRISLGLLFDYIAIHMVESETKPDMLTFTLGIQYRTESFGFGASVFNPYSFSIKSTDFYNRYPYWYRLGWHKQFQDKFLFTSQISFHEEYNWFTHWGLQYTLLKQVVLRAGVQTGQPEWSFGVGFFVGAAHIDLAFSHHQYLGFSPAFTLYFRQP